MSKNRCTFVRVILLNISFLYSFSLSAEASRTVMDQQILEMKNYKRIREEDGLAIRGKIHKSLFRTLGIELNKSSLKDIKDGNKPLNNFRAVVNDIAVQRSCFVGPDSVIIGFDSGPLSNVDLTIDGIFFSRSPNNIEDQKKCTLNKTISMKTQSDGGFSLQWNRGKIIEKLGMPISKSKDHMTYIYSSTKFENSKTVDVVSFITFKFHGNSMIEFAVSSVEST